MEEFKKQQKEGSDRYEADKGAFKPYDPTTELLCVIGKNIKDGFVTDISSPIRLVETIAGMYGGEEEEEIQQVVFASVEDKRVSLMALDKLCLSVGESAMLLGKNCILIDAPRFQQSGFLRKNDYQQVSESQRTGMDVFMDFVKLAVDIASLFFPGLDTVEERNYQFIESNKIQQKNKTK